MVDAKVNGKPAHFLLNSSAPVSTISAKFAASQKLAANQVAGQDVVTVPKFELNGAALNNEPFVEVDQLSGADGVLGQSLLQRMDVEYDLASGKVVLAKADGCEKSNMAYWAKDSDLISVMPLAPPVSGPPHTDVKVAVNGVILTGRFDTAAPFSVISAAAAEKAGVKTSDASVRPVKGRKDQWLASFTVNVGGEEAKNAPLMISAGGDASYDVLIGADYFLTHHIYVANSQHKIYATRTGNPAAPMFTAHQPPDLAPGEASSRALGGIGAGS
jgi:hypothetical protein